MGNFNLICTFEVLRQYGILGGTEQSFSHNVQYVPIQGFGLDCTTHCFIPSFPFAPGLSISVSMFRKNSPVKAVVVTVPFLTASLLD